ncbi:hypothetical protein EV182_008432, partial [Spiromyces aspiralis]
MRRICEVLQKDGFKIAGVYCLESQFIEDTAKYFAGVMSAMSAMFNLEVPHINVMTKMDLISEAQRKLLDRYFDPDPLLLGEGAISDMGEQFRELNLALANLIDDFSMVSFIPLNIKDENSISYVLSHADNALQWGEDQEPREPQ